MLVVYFSACKLNKVTLVYRTMVCLFLVLAFFVVSGEAAVILIELSNTEHRIEC